MFSFSFWTYFYFQKKSATSHFISQILFFLTTSVTTTETSESIVEEIPMGNSHSLKRLKKSHESSLLDISSPESDANDSIPIDQIIEMDFGGPTCASCRL